MTAKIKHNVAPLFALLVMIVMIVIIFAGCGTEPVSPTFDPQAHHNPADPPVWTPSEDEWMACCYGPGPCDMPVDPNCDESCQPGLRFNRHTWACDPAQECGHD